MVLGAFQYRLIQLPRLAKRLLLAACDTVLIGAVTAISLAIIFFRHPQLGQVLAPLVAVAVVAGVPILESQGLYRAIIRFIGTEMVYAMAKAMTLLAIVVTVSAWLLTDGDIGTSVSVGLVFWAFGVLVLSAGRLAMRAFVSRQQGKAERVLIYGAGEAGLRLATALAGNRDFLPLAFLDDNPALHGRLVAGIPVCPPTHLPTLIAELSVRRVLLALPSVPRHIRQGIIGSLASHSVHVQTMPDIADLVRGRARVDELREVETLDILGRDPVPPNEALLRHCITDRSVMVTGAGGSIGSELCRQIVELAPCRLVLFELCELALYRIERELRQRIQDRGLAVELVALLGSVHHRDRARSIMRAFQVQTVYHAAAYKHVPIVEHNMVEGIHNNVIGTWNTAEAAEDAGVETFVLISTDKAVSPVNVMGATKRFAELVLQGMTERGCRTRFCLVRFGNVLESSGSVVPLFREQIRKGGPVTVTHPDVIRYFMTIPEAAQLVIQAGAMGRGGDVFVLDMGEPVRIADLARRMIQLSGLSVCDDASPDGADGDVAIEYTGLRHGEKLFEELLLGNNVASTDHPMILRAYEEALPWETVNRYLEQLLAAANSFDCQRAHGILLDSVNGFVPVCEDIEDLVWQASCAPAAAQPAPLLPFQLAGAGSG